MAMASRWVFFEAMIPPGSLIIDFAVPHVSEVWPRPRGDFGPGGSWPREVHQGDLGSNL